MFIYSVMFSFKYQSKSYCKEYYRLLVYFWRTIFLTYKVRRRYYFNLLFSAKVHLIIIDSLLVNFTQNLLYKDQIYDKASSQTVNTIEFLWRILLDFYVNADLLRDSLSYNHFRNK